jgi:cellulose synthase/poly-beta-1,6-N-acetylglucosamine synthase-like glycosyltransferase
LYGFFLIVSLVLLSFYFLFLAYLIINMLLRSKTNQVAQSSSEAPPISVIIPFKNEAHNLQRLLDSLMAQDYRGEFEILLVNDNSTDDFEMILSPFLARAPRPITVIASCFDESLALTSKQQALDMGVARAAHEWLLFADADMEFDRNWITSMAWMTPYGHDLVFGHTALRKKTGDWFGALQSFQLEFLFAVAYAFYASNLAGSCMGNNLLVKKEAYLSIGGQKGLGPSIVEDFDLLRAFKHRGFSIAAAEPFLAAAFTYPCKTARGFLSQALRWARGGLRLKSRLLPPWALFCFQNAVFLLSLFGLPSGPVQLFSFVNTLTTVAFVFVAFRKIRSTETLLLLPLYYAFLLAETLGFLGARILAPGLSWKGRDL